MVRLNFRRVVFLSVATLSAALFASAAFGQAGTRVTGSSTQPIDIPNGSGSVQTTYTCTGEPTCVGTYTTTVNFSFSVPPLTCSANIVILGAATVTGLNLAQAGPIQGNITSTSNTAIDFAVDANGCPVFTTTTGPVQSSTTPYMGTWNGQTGVLTTTDTSVPNMPATTNISFTAIRSASPPPPPPFPMTVTGGITNGIANFQAQIQYRPQDVGTAGGVFVFAFAPANIVKDAVAPSGAKIGDSGKDAPVQCVLAQVTPSGQLQGVTSSSLQAYVTGTLSAQGQSVTLLNNVPASGIAGATIYVGYGANPSGMLTTGTFQGAVTVPGAAQCTGVSYEGLWLKSDESGWGLNLTHQGSILFATWFTYDTDGSGMWLVMSNGTQTSSGNFTGTLYRTTGPAFNAVPFTAIAFPANYTQVGTLTLSFTDANTGTMSYTVNGVSQTKAITRYIYATGGTNCTLIGSQGVSPNYQDLWLKADEAGWGVNLAHQGDILFATWFTYQAGGKGQWLVMSNGAKTAPGVYTGGLQRTTGPAFSAVPFNPSVVTRSTVGSATFTFSDANNGTFSYTVDGIAQSKRITRYIYSGPATVCQ